MGVIKPINKNVIFTDADLLNSDMAKREVAAIFRSDISLMISSVEVALLQRLFNVDANLIHYCPFMLSQAQLTQTNPSYQQREDFLAIGNFRHAPNWDAVLWLKQQVWPLIRKQLPKAPTEYLRRLSATESD